MLAGLIFILGLMVGSFLNVVIYRLPAGESIVTPRSHCPECGTELQARDLIPVVSFLLTRGKCRYCGAEISYQYPLVELITGFIFFTLHWKYNLNFNFIIYTGLVSTLLVISVIDIRQLIIPNKLTYPGIVVGLLVSFFSGHLSFLSSLAGVVFPGLFLLIIVIVSGGGMGVGDVKLAAMVGSFLGVKHAFFAIFLGAIVGSILSIGLLISGTKGWKSKLPFGVFISLGAVLMVFWGLEIIEFYWQLVGMS